MEAREIEIKEKWGPIKSRSDEDLKKIAKDLYNGLIFTDRQCGSDVMSTFMVMFFMGPQPPKEPQYPNMSNSIENNRDNALYDLLKRDSDQAKYKEDMEWYEVEQKYYKEQQLKSIGLVYEYISEAGPTSINGKPCFFSLRLLNHEDTTKMFEYYTTYKEIREKADNF